MSINSDERGKIRSWADGIIREVKEAFGIRTDSAVMREEVGKKLAQGVANGIYENDKEVVKQFKLMLDKLKYERDTDLISEDEYYRGLEQLRDRYFAAGTQQWQKYTAEIYKHQKDVLETERAETEKMYSEISDYASARMDEIIAKQQRYSDELANTGRLFDVNTATINGVKYSYYSMHDLDADIERLSMFGDMLEEIRTRADDLGFDRGNTEGLLTEIKEMNLEDALGYMQVLLQSGDKGFADYLSTWTRKNDVAEALSAHEYKNEFESSIEDAYTKMCEKLSEAGYEIPEGFYVSGSVSAQNFGTAFIEELDKQLEEIRGRIEAFGNSLSASVNIGASAGGNVVYNNETSYNISSADGADTVEQIRRYETVKRLSGVSI